LMKRSAALSGTRHQKCGHCDSVNSAQPSAPWLKWTACTVQLRKQADSCCQAGVLASTLCSPQCGELSMLSVGGPHTGVRYRLNMCCKLGKTTGKLDNFGRSRLLPDASRRLACSPAFKDTSPVDSSRMRSCFGKCV